MKNGPASLFLCSEILKFQLFLFNYSSWWILEFEGFFLLQFFVFYVLYNLSHKNSYVTKSWWSTRGGVLVGYRIPRKKSPSPKNPHPQKTPIPWIWRISEMKIPRFSKIPNLRDKIGDFLRIFFWGFSIGIGIGDWGSSKNPIPKPPLVINPWVPGLAHFWTDKSEIVFRAPEG